MSKPVHSQPVSLILVVAHTLEARPLLAALGLKPLLAGPFKIYGNDSGLRLIVSGMGKVAAAAAVAYGAAMVRGSIDPFLREDNQTAPGFLNFGIAGHGAAELGSGFIINKVIDCAGGDRFYPTLLPTVAESTTLLTVDRPELDYADAIAYDMEGAGFWQSACHFTPVDRIQLYKIISDNPRHDASTLTRADMATLIDGHIEQTVALIAALQELFRRQQVPHELPRAWTRIGSSRHLTVSQKHQLKRLCQRYRALGREQSLEEIVDNGQSARQLIQSLESRLLQQER